MKMRERAGVARGFRLYQAGLISILLDGDGLWTETLDALLIKQKPEGLYLIPTLGNSTGAPTGSR